MTDPLEACLQELNYAAQSYEDGKRYCEATGLCRLCEKRYLEVNELRHKYNAMVIARGKEDDHE